MAAPESPSLDAGAGKEGFDLTSAEKYERGARASYAAERDRATGGRGGAGGGGLAGIWRRRKWWIVVGGLLALAVIVGIAVGVPVAYVSLSRWLCGNPQHADDLPFLLLFQTLERLVIYSFGPSHPCPILSTHRLLFFGRSRRLIFGGAEAYDCEVWSQRV